MAQVKGIAVTSRLGFVKERFGEEGYGRLRAALTPEDNALIDARILPHVWVPFDLFVRVNVEADRLFGDGDLQLCFEMGRYAADKSLPTIFKLFFRLGTPMYLYGKAAKLWLAHYDSGRLEPVSAGEGKALLQLHDFQPPHRAHCLSVLGWAARSVELSGGTVLRAEERHCRTRGAPHCELVMEWS